MKRKLRKINLEGIGPPSDKSAGKLNSCQQASGNWDAPICTYSFAYLEKQIFIWAKKSDLSVN